ncbi:hypothetical protein [Alicyclobacillus fastidiosus]|uniref:hypothetical protein n=1 Tax=Alicyclobacillus fastidiosus TaxID=392011 RepID=UPI0024E0B7AA|nr:hypothetical protein [Alicyclobacillus fastidiosus]
MITRAHATRFIGQHIHFRTRDGGTHHGILHSVTNDGIYVRPVSGGTTRLASETDVSSVNIDLLQNMPSSTDDVQEVFGHFSSFPCLQSLR